MLTNGLHYWLGFSMSLRVRASSISLAPCDFEATSGTFCSRAACSTCMSSILAIQIIIILNIFKCMWTGILSELILSTFKWVHHCEGLIHNIAIIWKLFLQVNFLLSTQYSLEIQKRWRLFRDYVMGSFVQGK